MWPAEISMQSMWPIVFSRFLTTVLGLVIGHLSACFPRSFFSAERKASKSPLSKNANFKVTGLIELEIEFRVYQSKRYSLGHCCLAALKGVFLILSAWRSNQLVAQPTVNCSDAVFQTSLGS